MKSMIVYASRHHGNTGKIVKHLADRYGITLVNAEETDRIDYSEYDLIGFASGIDFGKFYDPVTELAEQLPAEKRIYALYTCAQDREKYGGQIEEIAGRMGCRYMGKLGCKGYNTYGPWKLIGGMNKGHPNADDLERVCLFYEKMMLEGQRK